jgi:hypothetical protein
MTASQVDAIDGGSRNCDSLCLDGGALLITALSNGVPCPAPTGFPNVGSFAPYTVFALNGSLPNGTQTGNFSLVTVNGDVGVAAKATITNQAPSVVNGNVFVDQFGKFTGPGKVHGTIFTNLDLSSERTDALNASAMATALPPDQTFSNITSGMTITGVTGLNVINVLGNISLNNGSLLFTGPADAFFVVNVGHAITLGGSGGIGVTGAVPVQNLLLNMTGSGNGLINTHVGNFVQGTLLGPNVGGQLDGSFGSLLLGQNFSLLSGATVNFEGCKP